MPLYTKINHDGSIKSIGSCPAGTLHLQAGPGQRLVAGHFDKLTETFDIVDGEPKHRRKTQEEIGRDTPDIVDLEDRGAGLTKKELKELLKRIDDLEKKI